MSTPLQIGLVLFPKVTQLDFTGPLQVFSSVPGAKVHLIWKRIEPVTSDSVLMLTPTTTFADCPQLDVICVPGGLGTDDMVNDEEMLAFLRKQAEGAKYITSVCTGSLVLGAAGLLKGYRAATHWTAMDFLSAFGATPTKTRVCVDRNRVTGGGVTAGIDFALTLVSLLVDRRDRGSDPAPARIQSGAAVQFRLARHRAAGSPRLHEGADRAGASPPRRDDRPRRRAAGVNVARARTEQKQSPHKEKGRLVSQTAFPVLRQPHINGRFQNLCTGGLSPSRILIGCRCISGQSRTGARTDAMVSHLRKMAFIEPRTREARKRGVTIVPAVPVIHRRRLRRRKLALRPSWPCGAAPAARR